MTWVKLDDGFTEHRKLELAGPLAGWMHVCALCYCARNLTDGRFPKSKALRLADVPKPAHLAAKLVEVGLWEDDGDDYVIHDFGDYNPSRSQVEQERKAGAERQRRSRLSRRDSSRDSHVTESAGSNESALRTGNNGPRTGTVARSDSGVAEPASAGAQKVTTSASAELSRRDKPVTDAVSNGVSARDPVPVPVPDCENTGLSVTSTAYDAESDDDEREPANELLQAAAAILGRDDHEQALIDGVAIRHRPSHLDECVRRRRAEDPRLAELVRRNPDLTAAQIAALANDASPLAAAETGPLGPVGAPAIDPDCQRCDGTGVHFVDEASNTMAECECKFREVS